jgi:hypothetical protein
MSLSGVENISKTEDFYAEVKLDPISIRTFIIDFNK